MSLWFDRIFTAGILFLIVATPFAFGTVHPWAYSTMEAVIFSLVIVWMAKLVVTRSQRSAHLGHQSSVRGRRSAGSREQGAKSKVQRARSKAISDCGIRISDFQIRKSKICNPMQDRKFQIRNPQSEIPRNKFEIRN